MTRESFPSLSLPPGTGCISFCEGRRPPLRWTRRAARFPAIHGDTVQFSATPAIFPLHRPGQGRLARRWDQRQKSYEMFSGLAGSGWKDTRLHRAIRRQNPRSMYARRWRVAAPRTYPATIERDDLSAPHGTNNLRADVASDNESVIYRRAARSGTFTANTIRSRAQRAAIVPKHCAPARGLSAAIQPDGKQASLPPRLPRVSATWTALSRRSGGRKKSGSTISRPRRRRTKPHRWIWHRQFSRWEGDRSIRFRARRDRQANLFVYATKSRPDAFSSTQCTEFAVKFPSPRRTNAIGSSRPAGSFIASICRAKRGERSSFQIKEGLRHGRSGMNEGGVSKETTSFRDSRRTDSRCGHRARRSCLQRAGEKKKHGRPRNSRSAGHPEATRRGSPDGRWIRLLSAGPVGRGRNWLASRMVRVMKAPAAHEQRRHLTSTRRWSPD